MENTLMLIAGCLAVLVGILVIIKRSSFTKFTSDAQRATFGKAGDKVADQASSGMTALVGVVFVLIGAAMVVLALIGVEI
ncbi:hypothetical protein [Arthrobacter sp. ZGTC412]|uniref:hypothetical protein n=1 Tax=Arthrobacter sp. ZGTC412 TaxID=2058900 RepID=UPI000CE31D0C|nr:hypothetical protein [Arthrobacter sp. ZGTC412]